MCCFAFLNCYIYEASKKWRNRQMKQEQVLALYDAYADSVYRVALGYLRSPHDAEDAVQAVFCKLMEQKLSVYPSRERAFLTKLTVNHCKNQLAAAKVCTGCTERSDPARRAGGSYALPRRDGAAGEISRSDRPALHGGVFLFRNCRVSAHYCFRRFNATAQSAKHVGRTTWEGLTWSKI